MVRKILFGVLCLVCIAIIAVSVVYAPLPTLSDHVSWQTNRATLFNQLSETGPFGWHPGGWQVMGSLAAFVFLQLVSCLVLFLAPDRIRNLEDSYKTGFAGLMRLAGLGFLTILAVCGIAFLGFFAVIATPVSFLLLISLVMTFWFGITSVILSFGRWLVRIFRLNVKSPIWIYAISLLVFFTLGRIPVIGWAILLFSACLAVGAMVVTRLGTNREWTIRELEE